MGINNFIWAPAGVRNSKGISYRKYKSWEEMIAAEDPVSIRHQAFLAHECLIDELLSLNARRTRCGFGRRGTANGCTWTKKECLFPMTGWLSGSMRSRSILVATPQDIGEA